MKIRISASNELDIIPIFKNPSCKIGNYLVNMILDNEMWYYLDDLLNLVSKFSPSDEWLCAVSNGT